MGMAYRNYPILTSRQVVGRLAVAARPVRALPDRGVVLRPILLTHARMVNPENLLVLRDAREIMQESCAVAAISAAALKAAPLRANKGWDVNASEEHDSHCTERHTGWVHFGHSCLAVGV